ncbi:MAG: Uma2 family endonuclease [Deltaproteobacteria bacterium]|nr:Uma2 family endonuclease [Deltaproteobacteria bacterium]
MQHPAAKRASCEDLLKVPDRMLAQIIDGELVVLPRPASGHARASSALGAELFGPFDRPRGGSGGPGGWWILDEPELHLGDDVLVPDLAGWRRERMPAFPADAAFFVQAPDWVCEVLSPSTVRLDRIRKLGIYAREAVAHVWLVEPHQQILEVFRLEQGRWVVAGQFEGAARVRAEPFAEVELELERWWPPEAPPAR